MKNIKRLLLSFALLSFLCFLGVGSTDNGSISNDKSTNKWYTGGTLHSGSVAEWNGATYANKLATAADWAMTAPQIKKKVKNSGSIDTLKPFAIELVICVNEAAGGQGYGSMSVSELAAGCIILM